MTFCQVDTGFGVLREVKMKYQAERRRRLNETWLQPVG